MTDYHKRVLHEALRDYVRAGLDPEERLTVDVLTLFGEAQRLAGDRYSRQVPRRPTLGELDTPGKRRGDY